MSTAAISVLIACFDAAATIGETLESVLKQTLSPIEIIVVDDGSVDGSAEVVDRYISRGVQLIRQPNRGASAARNRAFASSMGAFVMFIDADDLIAPAHLESLHHRLVEEPSCVALSRWDRFYSDPSEARFPNRETELDLPGVDWLVLDWRIARPMTQSGMFLIPRELIEEHGGWDEDLSLIDDFEFFARIISRSGGVRFAPEARLFYRSGLSQSLSSRKTRTAVESALRSLILGTSYLLEAEDSQRTRRVCANLLQDFEYTYYPRHPDLCVIARARAIELGGATLDPDGPPGFHKLRRFLGWKLARRVERMVYISRTRSA